MAFCDGMKQILASPYVMEQIVTSLHGMEQTATDVHDMGQIVNGPPRYEASLIKSSPQ